MNRVEDVLIHCELTGSGMFPGEVSVRIHAADGEEVMFFVDRSLLQDTDGQMRIRVTRLQTEHDISVCLLPAEVQSGSRWVRIRSDDLQVA